MKLKPLNPKRDFGVDALRILSMLMIAAHHIITHGGLLKSREKFSAGYDALIFLELAVLCAVNCYVLISGYVGASSRYKYSNLAALWLEVFCYSAGITVLFYCIDPKYVTVQVFVKSLIPVLSREYWFFTCYFIMFLFVPILNAAVEHLSRRRLEALLLSLFLIIGVGTSLYQAYYGTGALINTYKADSIDVNRGYSAWWMMVMYLAGAYIRKYDVFAKTPRYRFLLVFIACVGISTWLKLFVQRYTIDKYGAVRYDTLLYHYTSLNIWLCALMLFLFFRGLRFKAFFNRIIAFLTPMVFGVYLIHDHPLIRNNIVKKKLVFLKDLSTPRMFLMIAGIAVGIYLICSMIDLIRFYIFKLLHIKPLLVKLEDFLGRKLFRHQKAKDRK